MGQHMLIKLHITLHILVTPTLGRQSKKVTCQELLNLGGTGHSVQLRYTLNTGTMFQHQLWFVTVALLKSETKLLQNI